MGIEKQVVRDWAEQILHVMETPIEGSPTITINNRENALRLLSAALDQMGICVSDRFRQWIPEEIGEDHEPIEEMGNPVG